jgi:hypothetical protein
MCVCVWVCVCVGARSLHYYIWKYTDAIMITLIIFVTTEYIVLKWKHILGQPKIMRLKFNISTI